MGKYYLTTPIYYVNDLPHVGHLYTTLVADTVARFRRSRGEDVYFLTGTDEHGQKIERAAAEKGISPLELADRVVSRYHDWWKTLSITNDDFIRTTEERHRIGVFELIRRIEAAGDLYTARHEGWYCTACETYYTEKELVDGKLCPDHRTPCAWQSEENVFFRLSRHQDALLAHFRDHPAFVSPESRFNEVRSFVESGLKDLSVSRTNLSWGIPFPNHPGHVVYVWLDALANYITALGFGGPDDSNYRRYWEDPAGERVHVVGKDILRFHAVYWPAFLLSAGLPLPSRVCVHGWWLRDEKKCRRRRETSFAPRPSSRASAPTLFGTSSFARWFSGRTRISPTRLFSTATTRISRTASGTRFRGSRSFAAIRSGELLPSRAKARRSGRRRRRRCASSPSRSSDSSFPAVSKRSPRS